MASSSESLKIVLASEFKAKGFSDAEKRVAKFDKSIKKLGASLAGVLGAKAIMQYGIQSVKAFAADEKAATLLANSLRNLGLAYDTKPVEDFIASMERQFHVADDQLRPAFQALVQQTQSVTISQKLLQTALDVSAGSGMDLQTVVMDLNQAWVGNTKGLKKYNLGLTAAELKTTSFNKILSKLSKNYKGDAKAAANTYQGKIDALTISFNNMKETIGKGVVDALSTLSTDKSIDILISKIDEMALALADIVRGIGEVGKAFQKIPGLSGASFTDILGLIPIAGTYLSALAESGRNSRINAMGANPEGGIGGSQSSQQYIDALNAKKRAQQDREALRRQRELAALLKAQNKSTKDTLLAKKLGGIFDLNQIQVMAALQGNITKEEKLRLELQLAMLQGNTEAAQKLAEELAAVQGQTGMLSLYLRTLPDAKNPFASWADYLKAIEEQLKRISTTSPTAVSASVINSTASTASAIAAASASTIGSTAWIEAQKQLAASGYYGISGTYTGVETNVQPMYPQGEAYAGGYGGVTTINLNLDGQQIGSVIVDNLQNQTASGVLLGSSRLQPDWNYAV